MPSAPTRSTFLDSAHAAIRRAGYEPRHFCFRVFSAQGELVDWMSSPSEGSVVVGVVWPGVKPIAYRIAHGGWARDFGHDLRFLRFDRRSRLRRCSEDAVPAEAELAAC